MRNLKKIILFFIILTAALLLNVSISDAATLSVETEEELINAINTFTEGENIIEITENIYLTRPIEITEKTLTINGNGHTISKVDTNWTPNGSNGTLITAGLNGTKLTLTNLTLKDAQKYGVQTYNGAHVILNGVTLSNNGFGGVLVNGGTLEVRNLTLGKNGTPNNNGIEIAKGESASNDAVSKLIMNGTLSSSETTNVIFLAENDQLDKFEIQNSDTTTNKILIQGNKVAITDAANNVLFTSNENANITMTEVPYTPDGNTTEGENPPETDPDNNPNENPDETPVETPTETPTETKEPETPKSPKDNAPKTGVADYLGIVLFIICISIIGLALSVIL